MKYILSESRLKEFILNYLDTFVESNVVYESGPFFFIGQPSGDVDDYGVIPQYMEYDFTDGRLWISKTFKNDFILLFPLTNEQAEEIIVPWFENKFNVEVKFVES